MQDRIPMGTYPKWIAKLIRWTLNKRLPVGVTILLRGRGKCTDKLHPRTYYSYGVPLKHSTRAALYLIKTRPMPKPWTAHEEARFIQAERRPIIGVATVGDSFYKPAGDDYCTLREGDDA